MTSSPDLNFPAYEPRLPADVEEVRRRLQVLNQTSPSPKSEEKLGRALDRITAPDPAPDEPRVRANVDPSRMLARRRRRDGARLWSWGGVVEVANTPGDDFDYRVAVSVTDSDTLRCEAVVILARPDGPEVRPGKVTRSGEAIARAMAALTARANEDDVLVHDMSSLEAEIRRARWVEPDEPDRLARTSSAKVDEEAERVAKLRLAWEEAGRPGGYLRWVAQRMGEGFAGKAGEKKVSKRMARAEELRAQGLIRVEVPKKSSPTRRG